MVFTKLSQININLFSHRCNTQEPVTSIISIANVQVCSILQFQQFRPLQLRQALPLLWSLIILISPCFKCKKKALLSHSHPRTVTWWNRIPPVVTSLNINLDFPRSKVNCHLFILFLESWFVTPSLFHSCHTPQSASQFFVDSNKLFIGWTLIY